MGNKRKISSKIIECYICGEEKRWTKMCWFKGFNWLAMPPHEDYFSIGQYNNGKKNLGYTEFYWFRAHVCPECRQKKHQPVVEMPGGNEKVTWQ